MIKLAELELTEAVDPATGLKIAVSTTTRKFFRAYMPDKYAKMRNIRLNIHIARLFFMKGQVVHHFRIGENKTGVAEIRSAGSGLFFISAIRDGRIDILTVQSKYFQPKYNKTTTPIAPDEDGVI